MTRLIGLALTLLCGGALADTTQDVLAVDR